MPAPLGHEEFFNSLTTLLTNTSQKTKGSVYLTQKPLLNSSSSDTDKLNQPSILIRASDGNTNSKNPKTHPEVKDKKKSKSKLSTVVQQSELETFYARYAEVCKAGMTGLKKRDRKLKKAKAKGGAGKVVKG
ncbi:hypothetical protein ASPVEDRAFT_151996 [Aspergillus versicolor CBS 583.65]|uniref:Signal recognition particle subunit SRP14 n=1 Tax=Aspergillus versicolor CBS 583.65 TaxID=1036611 RepID=A0A1L9PPT0_ASPVE|nr:uncharacterized protein ASPVEDRAFT_151996 [Aspergillus versicolor CBS 583.65]OJJ03511.1 hypothetical protein ASPVEDRAFT_151996 [Aspergillus versicolor CBS 583.65]